MLKMVGLIRQRTDLSSEAFQAHWLGTHSAIARRLPGLRRYVVNFIDRADVPEAEYDGFSELWFDSRAAMDEAFKGPVGAEIEADIPRFIGSLTRVIIDEHEIVGG